MNHGARTLDAVSTVEILQYLSDKQQMSDHATKLEDAYTNKKHREAFDKLDVAIADLSAYTGISEEALHTQVRDAMGFDGWWIPSEVVINQVLQTVALIEGNHSVVKWLKEVKEGDDDE